MISAGVCILLIFFAAITGCLVYLFVTVVKLLTAILGIPFRWTVQLNERTDGGGDAGPGTGAG